MTPSAPSIPLIPDTLQPTEKPAKAAILPKKEKDNQTAVAEDKLHKRKIELRQAQKPKPSAIRVFRLSWRRPMPRLPILNSASFLSNTLRAWPSAWVRSTRR